jgi:hypothetical protein
MPLCAELTTTGRRSIRPRTMLRTFSIWLRLATELPPNFMTIMVFSRYLGRWAAGP